MPTSKGRNPSGDGKRSTRITPDHRRAEQQKQARIALQRASSPRQLRDAQRQAQRAGLGPRQVGDLWQGGRIPRGSSRSLGGGPKTDDRDEGGRSRYGKFH